MMYYEEVLGQPDAIRKAAQGFDAAQPYLARAGARLQQRTWQRIVLTGMGASYTAAYPALIYLRAAGYNAMLIETSELLHYQMGILDDTTLLIAISQSGQSVEIARLVEALHGRVPFVGVTNDPGSPLAASSDAFVLLHAGSEDTVSTKTYTTTLAALHLLARSLDQQDIRADVDELLRLSDAIENHMPAWRQQAENFAATLKDLFFLTFMGRGPSQASAMTGALIVKESAKIGTEGLNCGQFRHGPVEIVDEHFGGVLFAGGDDTRALNLGLAEHIARLDGKLAVIDPGGTSYDGLFTIPVPGSQPSLLPVVEIIPVQFLAGALAAQRGIQPGTFRYISKVTTIE